MKLWYLILLIMMITLTLSSCGKPPPPPDVPTLTSQQVISIIQVYGTPHINYYLKESGSQRTVYGSPYSAGQWAAVYTGNGSWRVQGTVGGSYDGKNYYCSTTWTYTYDDKEIKLVEHIVPLITRWGGWIR